MKPARWYLDRLFAMSAAEVAHRLRAAVPTSAPSRAMAAYAKLTPRFRPALVVDEQLADAIVAGYRDVLGLGRIRLSPNDTQLDVGDSRLSYELHRGHDWVAVAPFAQHRDWLARALAEWRADHPVGAGAVWSSPMEAAIRIHSLLAVAAHADVPICAPMIFEHVRWLEQRLSAYSSANNHLVVELSALVCAARALRDQAPARAAPARAEPARAEPARAEPARAELADESRSEANALLGALEAAVANQVFDDGVHAEMATHYHAFVLESLAIVAASERAFGFTHAWLDSTIAAMAEYLEVLRCADGSLLQQGDDDGGRILPGFVVPRAVAASSASSASSRAFRNSGQVVLRSQRLHVAFDAGPFGFGTLAAHAHCDALAIYVAIDGLPFLVDRGTYKYADDDGLRDQLRATAAHNTLQIGTLEQARIAGPFLWKQHPHVLLEQCDLAGGPCDDVIVASHDGFAPFTHRRTLRRSGDVLHITDRADTALPLTVRFHFPPGLEVTLHGNVARTTRGSIAFGSSDTSDTSDTSDKLDKPDKPDKPDRSKPDVVVGRLVETPHSSQYGSIANAITLEVCGTVEISCEIAPNESA